MQVLVRYFLNLRDIVSTDAERIQLDEGATLSDLKTRLICKYEGLAPHTLTLKFVVNDVMISDKMHCLHEGDIVFILPSEWEG